MPIDFDTETSLLERDIHCRIWWSCYYLLNELLLYSSFTCYAEVHHMMLTIRLGLWHQLKQCPCKDTGFAGRRVQVWSLRHLQAPCSCHELQCGSVHHQIIQRRCCRSCEVCCLPPNSHLPLYQHVTACHSDILLTPERQPLHTEQSATKHQILSANGHTVIV